MKKIIVLANGLEEAFYEYVQSKDYQVVKIKESKSTYKAIAKHPDIFSFSLGDKLIIAPEITKFFNEDVKDKLLWGKSEIKRQYPGNICYNVARVGSFAIHNTKYTDPVIKENLNCQWIHVNQGYTKCNTLIVNDDSLVTSDRSIYKETTKEGLNCLLIRPEHIVLKGLDYGFIGGASVKIDNEIIFYGDISKHPDYPQIKEFIENRNLKIRFFEFPLEDIGSGVKLIIN